MASHNLNEAFEAKPPGFNDMVSKSVGEDLSGEGRNEDFGVFSDQQVPEAFKVAIPSADRGVFLTKDGQVSLKLEQVVDMVLLQLGIRNGNFQVVFGSLVSIFL
jgi:hypothetical protein